MSDVNIEINSAPVSVEVSAAQGPTNPYSLVILAEAGAIMVPIPEGSPAVNNAVRYFVTSSGGGSLTLEAGIVVPDGYSTFPYTMTAGKTYIVQLLYIGSCWALTSFVGPYTQP
jgi:hypothetical protein